MSEGHNYTVADDWNLANDFANFITKFVKALRTASRLRWLQVFPPWDKFRRTVKISQSNAKLSKLSGYYITPPPTHTTVHFHNTVYLRMILEYTSVIYLFT